jgi:cell division protease FtsH
MIMTMGGRVAEEIVFERVSTGAQNDLERITRLAYAMVVDYGMSEKVGYVSFNLSGRENEPLLDKPYSEATAELIDQEVKRLIDEVRAETRSLLQEKRDLLEALAQGLLSKEVLNETDLTEILGPRPFKRAGHEIAAVDAEGAPVNLSARAPVGGDGAAGPVQEETDPETTA